MLSRIVTLAADGGGDLAFPFNIIERYGLAGGMLLIIGWFLKMVVRHGVIPFVERTIQTQAAIVEKMAGIDTSAKATAQLVGAMHDKLSNHMHADEAVDREILRRIDGIRAPAAPPSSPSAGSPGGHQAA